MGDSVTGMSRPCWALWLVLISTLAVGTFAVWQLPLVSRVFPNFESAIGNELRVNGYVFPAGRKNQDPSVKDLITLDAMELSIIHSNIERVRLLVLVGTVLNALGLMGIIVWLKVQVKVDIPANDISAPRSEKNS